MRINFAMSRLSKRLFVRIIDAAFWYVYLSLLVLISFANQHPHSTVWLSLYAAIFLHAGAYFAFRCMRCKPVRSYDSAKVVIFLLAAMVLWLILQCLIPMTSYIEVLLFGENKPEWFNYSGVWSITPERTQWAVLKAFVVLVLFVVSLALIDRRRRVRELVFTLLCVGVIHALLAIFAKYLGVYFIDKVSLDGHFDAARGLFVNRNHLAAFSILCLFSAIAIQAKIAMLNKVNNLHSILFGQIIRFSFLIFTLGIFVILQSESRGALLALLLSLMIYITVLSSLLGFEFRRHYILLFIATITVLMMIVFGQGMTERFTSNALSLGERSTQWAITWQAIKGQWLLGYGAGSYAIVFQSLREFADLRLVIYDQAHNDFLHLLLEQGLIGLLLWLSFIFITIRFAINSCLTSQSTMVKSVLFACLVVVSALLIQSLVDYPLQIMTIRCYFFVIIATMFAVPSIRHQ